MGPVNVLTLMESNKNPILLSDNPHRYHSGFIRIRQYLIALVVIALGALFCFEVVRSLGYYIVAFIMLILVSILATFLKTGPVLMASLLSLLVWNFFFIPPHNTFHIDKTEDILMFGMFGLVVIMNGVFSTRVRRQEMLTRERERHTNALFQLTRDLSRTSGTEQVAEISVSQIKHHFALDAFIISPDETGGFPLQGSIGQEIGVSTGDYQAARHAYEAHMKTGRFTPEFPGALYSFYPLKGTLINPGIVALRHERPFSPDKQIFWETFLTQISNALEREFLAELARKARFLDESDRFYKTLFNSVSHELRIPVATILAASDALLGTPGPGGVQEALAREIYSATIRLNRLIDNLLNMSRLESGRISLRLDWYDLNDLIYKVLNDLKEELKAFTLVVNVPDHVPLIRMDYGLMEQVLYNLVFNACQYAPATSEIGVKADYRNGSLFISVTDQGPGFPPEAIDKLFNKFFRADESRTGGLGLGLSIVKGFTEAHQGRVTAGNRPGGGAIVTVQIPSDIPEIEEISIEASDA
jgi:two-component system sensor histidine kinase KdpD